MENALPRRWFLTQIQSAQSNGNGNVNLLMLLDAAFITIIVLKIRRSPAKVCSTQPKRIFKQRELWASRTQITKTKQNNSRSIFAYGPVEFHSLKQYFVIVMPSPYTMHTMLYVFCMVEDYRWSVFGERVY